MVKPDYCKYCGSNKLLFVKDNVIFNPELNIDEVMDSYICTECKTVYVDNLDFSFIQIEIENNKILQQDSSGLSSWTK